MKKIFFCFLLWVGVCIASPVGHALSVKTLTLDQLIAFSDRIFRGTVIDKTITDDPYESGFIVEYYTFKIDDCLKGNCGKQIVFKQANQVVRGMPQYKVGENYLVFLPESSEQTGLVAPVGMWQGLYEIKMQSGQLVVPALSFNKGVAAQVNKAATLRSLAVNPNPSDYASFKQVIEAIVQEEK